MISVAVSYGCVDDSYMCVEEIKILFGSKIILTDGGDVCKYFPKSCSSLQRGKLVN